MTLKSPLPRKRSHVDEKDFVDLIQKNIPSWTATWNMLLQANVESPRAGKRSKYAEPELHERICRKITELVDEEEALIDLYTKAADEAREKEKNFRSKTFILKEQLKQDKNLMKILKGTN